MKIKKAMILAAGLGSRLRPITKKTPKPLIKINEKNLLERSIVLLKNHGINEITINVHYLSEQIELYLKNNNFDLKINISNEKDEILDTGGGILKGTSSFGSEPFIVLNPDTVWTKNYSNELEILEKRYHQYKNCILLLVHKKLSFDNTFSGDFSLDSKNCISKKDKNDYIYTGMQILNRSIFSNKKMEKFSINTVWDKLISLNKLKGHISENIFYHVNTQKMFNKINSLKIIDL